MDHLDAISDAIEGGDTNRVAEILREHPELLADVKNDDAPLWSAWYSNRALLSWLLEYGVSPNQRDSSGGTVLMSAAAENATEMIELLIAHYADVILANESGETAFSYACAKDSFDAARLLHAAGADINTVDQGGGSPLDWAACWASWPFYAWLVSVGCRHVDGAPREQGSPPPFKKTDD
jgi:ankyrin repeat protein